MLGFGPISSYPIADVPMPPPSITFLFWNLKRGRADILASLARRHAVDLLMLAECPLQPATVLEALNQQQSDFFYVPTGCPKIGIYTRFSDEHLIALKDGADFSIRRLRLLNIPEILVSVVHFPSKLRQAPIDQLSYTVGFCDILATAEEEAGHARTVLIGDLNMNPYEDGLVTTRGLHAVTTKEIALRPTRKVKFESNLYFYNPMWRHFGEREEGHAGTFYYSSPKARADFWNVYDQVLIRPALLPFFRDDDLEIIHRDVDLNLSLLRRGLPDHESISDHLPILFRLRI